MTERQQLIVVAGHVCLDVIPTFTPRADGKTPDMRPGHLVHVGPALRSTGGAVSNTGLALHRLGMPVRLLGKIGDDLFGEEIFRLFQSHGSHLADGMVRVSGEQTSYSIVISPPGIDRTFLHHPGPNDTFSADDVSPDALNDACLFHFGYPPQMRRMWENDGEQLVQLLQKARNAGLTVTLDWCMVDPASEAGQVDWPVVLQRVLPLVDFFCPSADELMSMVDRPSYLKREHDGGFTPRRHLDLDILRKMAAQCLEWGAGVVVIKMGDQGLYLRSSESRERLSQLGRGVTQPPEQWHNLELYSPCYRANVVGTTGSGDCTIAGFLAGLVRGASPREIVQSAVATGAASVEAADAVSGVPHWSVLKQRLEEGWNQHEPLLKL